MLSYKQLSNKFTLSGPVLYKNQRGHVVAMNDLNHTLTIEVDGVNHPNVKYDEVDKYDR